MEKTISLSEALKLDIQNNWHKSRLLSNKELVDNIKKFYPCDCLVDIYTKTNTIESIRIFLINDICKIQISFDTYRKKYNIFSNENYKNLSNYDLSNISRKYKEPNNIGVLTTKKIEAWVKYIQDIHNECIIKNNQLTNEVDSFLDSIKNENVKWWDNNTSGEIIKNGIVFRFKIEKGYVSKKIEIHYSVGNELEVFKKLSNNNFK
jgi:hypothetical protein